MSHNKYTFYEQCLSYLLAVNKINAHAESQGRINGKNNKLRLDNNCARRCETS